jgi:hypothetical protein
VRETLSPVECDEHSDDGRGKRTPAVSTEGGMDSKLPLPAGLRYAECEVWRRS